MRFVLIFFIAVTALCLYFFAADEAGGGAGIGAAVFGTITVAVGGWNWYRNGSPLAEGRGLNDKAGK